MLANPRSIRPAAPPAAPAAATPYPSREWGLGEMVDYVKKFERVVTSTLIGMMAVVIVLAVADLTWVLVKDIISPPVVLLDLDELLDLFGMFLLVLIGIELLETLKAYVRERELRAEVIILVAIIALARKIVTLDVKDVPSVSLLGIAAIIVALGIAYYLIRLTHHRRAPVDRDHLRARGLDLEPVTRRQREIDAADANLPAPRDRLEAGQQAREAVTAERAVEEEHRALGRGGRELHGVSLDERDARELQAGRELARGGDEGRLDLDAHRARSREQMHERGGAPHARADVDEHVRGADLLRHAQDRVDRARQVRDAALRQVRAIVRRSAEPEHVIHPGVLLEPRDALEGRAELRRISHPAGDQRTNPLGALSMMLVHERSLAGLSHRGPCRACVPEELRTR